MLVGAATNLGINIGMILGAFVGRETRKRQLMGILLGGLVGKGVDEMILHSTQGTRTPEHTIVSMLLALIVIVIWMSIAALIRRKTKTGKAN